MCEGNVAMNTLRNTIAGILAALFAGGVANDASAQQPQSASAAAMLEEVVVTARRREESLQDLPLSIAAINADAMRSQGIVEIRQISDFVPNVTFRDSDLRGKAALVIRGIGGIPGGSRPTGAGVYLDGHYIPTSRGTMLSTLDLERVEVLRGPQGTLFGKNTTGGAVQFITAKPQPEFEADIELRVADFGTEAFRGMVNVPFSESVWGRFALASETSDGYWFNRTLNRDFGATDMKTYSAAVRLTPNDNWMIDVLARGNYDDSDSVGGQCRVRPNQDMIDRMTASGFDVSAYRAFANGRGRWGSNPANSVGRVDAIYPGATLDFWNNCTLDNERGDYVHSADLPGFAKLDTEFLNTTTQWDSNGAIGGLDNLNVRLIAGRLTNKSSTNHDRDWTPLAIDTLGASAVTEGINRDQKSLELLFDADVNDRWGFVSGVHAWDYEIDAGQDCLNTFLENFDAITTDFTLVPDGMGGFDPVGNDNVIIPCVPNGSNFGRLADMINPGRAGNTAMGSLSTVESVAVFGQLSFDMNEDWTLDFGARWTDETRTFNSVEHAFTPETCVHNPIHFLNNPDLPNAPAAAELEAMGLATSNPGAPPPGTPCLQESLLSFQSLFVDGFYNDLEASFSEVTPMVTLTRTLAPGDRLDSGIVYGTVSQGFLSGAFNDELNALLVPELAPLLTYQPEFVTNYEVGFKGTLADGRLRLSTAVFYMDYTDKQEVINIDNSDGRYGSDPDIEIRTNAASVDIVGLELELRAQPWDGGFLSLDVGYLHNEYGEFSSFDPDAPGGTVDLSDRFIRDFSPDLTVTASIEQAFQLGNGATLTPQLGLYYQSEYDYRRSQDGGAASVCNQGAYSKLRARATYRPQDGTWQASLFGSNITDERYLAYCDFSRSGTYDYHWGAPNFWGLEFVMSFGGN